MFMLFDVIHVILCPVPKQCTLTFHQQTSSKVPHMTSHCPDEIVVVTTWISLITAFWGQYFIQCSTSHRKLQMRDTNTECCCMLRYSIDLNAIRTMCQ